MSDGMTAGMSMSHSMFPTARVATFCKDCGNIDIVRHGHFEGATSSSAKLFRKQKQAISKFPLSS